MARIVEIASNLEPEYAAQEGNLYNMTTKIFIWSLQNSSELVERLQSIAFAIVEKNIKLLILDSIAALVRKEFDISSLHKRQDLLTAQANILKNLAEKLNIPIIVVNQVTSKFDETKSRRVQIVPALGTQWVTTNISIIPLGSLCKSSNCLRIRC
jgi:RAD51-like protein 1